MYSLAILFISLRFLAEVVRQTIAAKDRNETVDVFKIITEAARGRMGLPVDLERLKCLAT